MAWQDWATSNVVSTLNVNGQNYVIKDSVAKNNIEELQSLINTINGSVLHFIGTTNTAISDGDDTNPIQISGESYTAKNGDVVIYKPSGTLIADTEREYVWVGDTNGKWQEFGSTGALKALAFKDSASGSYTPAGTVSQPTFSGAEGSLSVSGTPAGTISVARTASGETGNFIPEGTIDQPTITITPTAATGKLVTAAGTAPTLTKNNVATTDVISSATYANETLTFASAVFAPGAAATLEDTPSALTAVSATASGADFHGTSVDITFSGSSLESTGTFTPSGTVSQPTFEGTAATITVS